MDGFDLKLVWQGPEVACYQAFIRALYRFFCLLINAAGHPRKNGI